MPRVLAIASSHAHISLVFNGAAAQWALTSDIHWRHEIGSDKVDPREYTDLRCSIFMKPGPNGSILACRKNVSAILLVAVEGDKSEVWGILHPEPAYQLPVEFLSCVPFVRVAR